MTENERLALDAVVKEHEYQKERWGTSHDQEHTPEEWLNILAVYLGKLGSETVAFQGLGYDPEKFKKRLTQIAAIALSASAVTSAGAPPKGTG